MQSLKFRAWVYLKRQVCYKMVEGRHCVVSWKRSKSAGLCGSIVGAAGTGGGNTGFSQMAPVLARVAAPCGVTQWGS